MKKLLILFLILLLCVPGCAEENPWVFDAGKQEITDYRGAGGEVTVPGQIGGSAVHRIAGAVFLNRSDVTAVTFGEGLQVLGFSTMNGVSALARVVLPQSLGAMEGSSLYNCPVLTEVTVPFAVGYIGENCFSWCAQLKKITFEGACPFFDRAESNFKMIAQDAVILVPDDQLDAYRAALPHVKDQVRPSGKEAIPAPVTAEADFTVKDGVICAYRGHDTHVVVPASVGGVKVTRIGENAFAGFDAYTVTVREGIEEIGEGAFRGADHLYGVELPSSLRVIGNDAFRFYYGNRVTLPSGLESIGAGAFSNATGVEEITLPASLRFIGSQAFANCKGLKKVTVQCDAGLLPADVFDGCKDPEIVYTAAASVPTDKPAQPAPAGDSPVVPEAKYICTGAEVGGTHRDAALLGGEYSMIFHTDGTVTFVMVGNEFAGMTWTVVEGQAVINSYGDQKLYCVPEGNGFTLDYFGSMKLEYVLQQQ